MVGEMVQNSQSLYSFTFSDVIIIHEYIDSHSATKFIFRKYINAHLKTNFLFTNIFTHIYVIIHSHSITSATWCKIQSTIFIHIHDQYFDSQIKYISTFSTFAHIQGVNLSAFKIVIRSHSTEPYLYNH